MIASCVRYQYSLKRFGSSNKKVKIYTMDKHTDEDMNV